MTDRDVIERVARLLDRAVVPLRAQRSHHKQPFAATIKGAPAVDLMMGVHGFMGLKRQGEIRRALLSWQKRGPRRRRQSGTCGVTACALRASKRGLCKRHYNSWWKANHYGRESAIAPLDVSAEFLSAVHACEITCDLSWLAGLLEGEGTFSATQTQGHNYPVLKVSMCSEDVVMRASRLIAAASVTVHEPEHEGWSVVYAAAISGSSAAEWMRRLRSLMGRRRTEAIDAALAVYHPIRLVDPPDSCVIPDCGEPHRGRGLCHKHYMMWSRDRAKGRVARIAPLR
jgi:hypothetical protein